MVIYTEKQKRLLKQIEERKETVDKFVMERVENPDNPIPLNYVLEMRCLTLQESRQRIIAQIAYMESRPEHYGESHVEASKRRLAGIDGQISEAEGFHEYLKMQANLYSREIEIYPNIV